MRGLREECLLCHREAEEAEEREIRAASERKMGRASEEALQLPTQLELLLAASAADLEKAQELLQSLGRGGRLERRCAIGLDVEWKPSLEKRGGMQKHRRSQSMEPCSTLQLAADDFAPSAKP